EIGQLVEFSLINSVGRLVNESAITDANGVAIVQLNPGDVSGAGSVEASASIGNYVVTGSVNFASAGDAPEVPPPYTVVVDVCDAGPCGTSLGSTPITGAAQGYAEATVLDDNSNPQVGELVTFSLINNVGVLEQTTALTDGAGI